MAVDYEFILDVILWYVSCTGTPRQQGKSVQGGTRVAPGWASDVAGREAKTPAVFPLLSSRERPGQSQDGNFCSSIQIFIVR